VVNVYWKTQKTDIEKRRGFSSLSGGQEEKLNSLANVNGQRQMTVISMQAS